MKISNELNNAKRYLGIFGLVSLPLIFTPAVSNAQNLERTPQKDTFETYIDSVVPKGTRNKQILFNAPDAEVEIAGIKDTARIVVDLSKNILYTYNPNGQADCAYLIASGKPRYPTDTGIRIVTHIETYPYRNAPSSTRRRRKPNDYGPNIICLEKVDPQTGQRSQTGEFIHGNNNPSSLGKYASLGCMRMDNDVIRKLAKEVKRGDIVVIKK